MHRFVDGDDRMQHTLLPHCLEDYVGEENPVRVIDVFIDELDLAALGFSGMTPAATRRPAYHPDRAEIGEIIANGSASSRGRTGWPPRPAAARPSDPPPVLPEEPTAVTPHRGICGGKSQQWLRYPTKPHVWICAGDVRAMGVPTAISFDPICRALGITLPPVFQEMPPTS